MLFVSLLIFRMHRGCMKMIILSIRFSWDLPFMFYLMNIKNLYRNSWRSKKYHFGRRVLLPSLSTLSTYGCFGGSKFLKFKLLRLGDQRKCARWLIYNGCGYPEGPSLRIICYLERSYQRGRSGLLSGGTIEIHWDILGVIQNFPATGLCVCVCVCVCVCLSGADGPVDSTPFNSYSLSVKWTPSSNRVAENC